MVYSSAETKENKNQLKMYSQSIYIYVIFIKQTNIIKFHIQ